MAKITVVLEELISESFEIDVPQELIDDKNGSKIIDIAIDMYNKKDLTVCKDNVIASYVAIDDPDFPNHFTEF
jgi:hypothetical protein